MTLLKRQLKQKEHELEMALLEVRMLKKLDEIERRRYTEKANMKKNMKQIKEMSEEEVDKGNTPNISLMCRILDVKRANYYKWLHHEKSIVDKENEEIAELVKEYHKKYNGLLGYRMMADRINRDHHRHYSDKRIYKIMRILGIQSIIRPKRRSYTVRKNNSTAKNNLNRDFNASKTNENG